mgnify:CR=1 FL=1
MSCRGLVKLYPFYNNYVPGGQSCIHDSFNCMAFLNIRKIPDEKTLENTLVHELIHMRFPYLAHGKRFNKLVRQGLRGKTFSPYKKRSKTPSF